MPGCLRALDVISTAAEQTMTEGEADLGWCGCRGRPAVRCGGMPEAPSTRWRFAVAVHWESVLSDQS